MRRAQALAGGGGRGVAFGGLGDLDAGGAELRVASTPRPETTCSSGPTMRWWPS